MPEAFATDAPDADLLGLLARLDTGEEVTLTRKGLPLARLVPLAAGPKPRLIKFGALRDRVWIADDFDAEDEVLNGLFQDGAVEPPPG